MPIVSPVIVIGLEVPVAVLPPGLDVTVYDVIGLPPVDVGGVKRTVACALPDTAADTAVGAPGGTWKTIGRIMSISS